MPVVKNEHIAKMPKATAFKLNALCGAVEQMQVRKGWPPTEPRWHCASKNSSALVVYCDTPDGGSLRLNYEFDDTVRLEYCAKNDTRHRVVKGGTEHDSSKISMAAAVTVEEGERLAQVMTAWQHWASTAEIEAKTEWAVRKERNLTRNWPPHTGRYALLHPSSRSLIMRRACIYCFYPRREDEERVLKAAVTSFHEELNLNHIRSAYSVSIYHLGSDPAEAWDVAMKVNSGKHVRPMPWEDSDVW